MKKSDIYREQAKLAAKEIQEWPDWMRRSITPPREQQEYEASFSKDVLPTAPNEEPRREDP